MPVCFCSDCSLSTDSDHALLRLPPPRAPDRPAPGRAARRVAAARRPPRRRALEHRTFRDLPELLAPGRPARPERHEGAAGAARRSPRGDRREVGGAVPRRDATACGRCSPRRAGYPELGHGVRHRHRAAADASRAHRRPPLADGTGASRDRRPKLLARYGHVPLPPYIRKGRDARRGPRTLPDRVRRARRARSRPRPPGLHFTPELFARLAASGIGTARVTLHVGLGTFAPVKVDDPAKHAIHREWCEVTQPTVDAIRAAKARGGRVVAVGTTTTRTLESAARPDGLKPFAARRTCTSARRSSSAWSMRWSRTSTCRERRCCCSSRRSRETNCCERAYAEAVAREYRFYSYGDAMLVL